MRMCQLLCIRLEMYNFAFLTCTCSVLVNYVTELFQYVLAAAVRPLMAETTALGAAVAAGAAEGVDVIDLRAHDASRSKTETFQPQVTASSKLLKKIQLEALVHVSASQLVLVHVCVGMYLYSYMSVSMYLHEYMSIVLRFHSHT